jgi:hypothetical protein
MYNCIILTESGENSEERFYYDYGWERTMNYFKNFDSLSK